MPEQLSGQITVTTAGTAEQGPDIDGSLFMLRFNGDGVGYVGHDGTDPGDVDSTTGHILDPGDSVPVEVRNLTALYFDSDTNGAVFSWLKMK